VVEAVPDEGVAREDDRVGLADVGQQEVPGGAGERAGGVGADVAAPDDVRARR